MKKIILAATIVLALSKCLAQQSSTINIRTMNKIDHVYTVFVTTKLEETVVFYEKYFGFSKLFESTFFVLLQTGSDQKFNIAFMDEKHPTFPPNPKAFNGNGAFLTLEVSDAKTLYEEMKGRGLTITYELKDEPWGQKRFAVLDPNNLWVDVVEQTQPADGYWDKYMKE